MGKRLIIKGANFSENAISIEYTLLMKGYDNASSDMAVNWRYDSRPATKKVEIHEIRVTVPKASKLDVNKASSMWVGVYDGVNNLDGLSKKIKIDMTAVVNEVINNGNTAPTLHRLKLPTPLVVEAGEFFAFAGVSTPDNETGDTNNIPICYASGIDGSLGYLMVVKNNSQSIGGVAIDWYGV